MSRALGGIRRPGSTWARVGPRSLHAASVPLSKGDTHWCRCSSLPRPLSHPLRSQSPPLPPPLGPLSGSVCACSPHPRRPAALAAAVGRPARPPDPEGTGGRHVAGRVLALPAPAPGAVRACLSRWSWEGVVSEWVQEGLLAPHCPPRPLLGSTALVADLEGLMSSVARGTMQHGEE